MAKSVYFYNCIRAIRKVTFGRDNRKPIADALIVLEPELTEQKESHSADINHILSTVQDKIDSLSNNTYKPFNGGSTQAIENDDYLLTITT